MTTGDLPHAALADQLASERATKNSFEQRGINVITTSGTLVALVIGFLSLAPDAATVAKPAVGAALAGFLLAAVGGLWVNRPTSIPAIPVDRLRDAAEVPQSELARDMLWYQADTLAELRKLNRGRARILTMALALQILALGSVAIGAFLLLLR